MREYRSPAYLALVAAVLLWLALIWLAPLARHHDSFLAEFCYAFFARICHQIPERSFQWLGQPLAVCHRCLGLYAGFALGLLIWPGLGRLRTTLESNPRLMVLFWIPMAVDLLQANSPWTRFLSGATAAFPLALFVILALADLTSRRSALTLKSRISS